MRSLFAALSLSLLLAATPGAARAQSADRSFYDSIAASRSASAPDNEDQHWSRDGRTGTIRFSARSGFCRPYVAVEASPTRLPPVSGQICAAAGESGSGTRGLGSGTRGLGAPRPPPPPTPAPAPTSPGGPTAAPTRPAAVRAVLVELARSKPRESVNGGHAVVLLKNTSAANGRNRALCDAIALQFAPRSLEQAQIGVERDASGALVALRPVYWLLNDQAPAATGSLCDQRLARYDYTRSKTIRTKLGLTNGDGPFLIVAKGDETQAQAIDLSRMSSSDIAKTVVFFRDSFSQVDRAWDAQAFDRRKRNNGLAIAWGGPAPGAVLAAFSFARPVVSALVGCVRGDLDDNPCR